MIPPKALIVDLRKNELFESFGQLPPFGLRPATVCPTSDDMTDANSSSSEEEQINHEDSDEEDEDPGLKFEPGGGLSCPGSTSRIEKSGWNLLYERLDAVNVLDSANSPSRLSN
jgi:hypothetical protein